MLLRQTFRVFKEIFETYNMADHPSYFFKKAFQTANREILKQMDEGRGMAAVSAVRYREDFCFTGLSGM